MFFEQKSEDEIEKYKRSLAEAGVTRKKLYENDTGVVDETLYKLACKKKQERIEREKKMKELVYLLILILFRVKNISMNGKE